MIVIVVLMVMVVTDISVLVISVIFLFITDNSVIFINNIFVIFMNMNVVVIVLSSSSSFQPSRIFLSPDEGASQSLPPQVGRREHGPRGAVVA